MALATVIRIVIRGPNYSTYNSLAEFGQANHWAITSIEPSRIEDAVNDMLPEGFYAKVEE